MIKVFIAGGTGMLGLSLANFLKRKGLEVIVQGYKHKADINLDLTQYSEACEALDIVNPDFIINLICLSDVDENERKPKLAFKLNVTPVKNIVKWIKSRNAQSKLIQISTDHVYDGSGFNSENEINIKNQYASTKLEAEKISSEVGALILRTNFFGKSFLKNRNSFTDWIDSCLKENQFPIKLFKDVYFSPLSIDTLSYNIFCLLDRFQPGVYNLGSSTGLSKADFVYAYSEFLKINKSKTLLISVDELDLIANRPKGMMMDVSKYEKKFGLVLPSLEEELKIYVGNKNEYKN